MSELRIHFEQQAVPIAIHHDLPEIQAELAAIGVAFERWTADQVLAADASSDDIITAYRADVDRLMTAHGFQSVDVLRMTPDHPDRAALRAKFLNEHTHTEFEVRFFVEGRGLFYLHVADKVYAVLCEQGDLISVPAGTAHWFDMGPRPQFTAIRLFTNPAGWVANFTGRDLADRFPRFEDAA
ncbi:cupin [Thiocapsa imhoffii]|uniref:Acireductone dioxygenase n=1 Tax=Thiocapsa imhoffii TaxID=382777 RepID=A0A9X1B9T9_9GAMM|nr:cupin [Thiocapsa imhoffii]MBK1645663.1 cupin [Thiocapsa imhoffii]